MLGPSSDVCLGENVTVHLKDDTVKQNDSADQSLVNRKLNMTKAFPALTINYFPDRCVISMNYDMYFNNV